MKTGYAKAIDVMNSNLIWQAATWKDSPVLVCHTVEQPRCRVHCKVDLSLLARIAVGNKIKIKVSQHKHTKLTLCFPKCAKSGTQFDIVGFLSLKQTKFPKTFFILRQRLDAWINMRPLLFIFYKKLTVAVDCDNSWCHFWAEIYRIKTNGRTTTYIICVFYVVQCSEKATLFGQQFSI